MPILSRMPRLPATADLRRFTLVTFVDSTGTSLYLTGAVVFFVRVLHLSAAFVGVGLTVAAAVGLAASIPAGRLADTLGAKKVLISCFLMEAALYGVLPSVRNRAEFLIVITCIALAASAASPARRVLMAELAGKDARVASSAYNRAVLNVGMGLGAAIAAGALAVGTRPAYDALMLGNAVSFVLAAGVISTIVGASRPVSPPSVTTGPTTRGRSPLREPRLMAAALSCGFLYLSAAVLDVGLALQITEKTAVPHWMIAALILLNTVLAVLLQVRASRGSESISGAATANRRAGVALPLACALFAFSSHRPALLASVVLLFAILALTAGELLSSAGSWGLSYGMAPDAQQGEYLAAFGMVSQGVQVAGPVLAALVVDTGAIAWLALGVGFLVVGLAAPVITSCGSRTSFRGDLASSR